MEKREPFDLTIGSDIMIFCDELPFGVLSSYHYLNIEIMNIISFYPGEDELQFEMDVDEYIVDLTNYMTDSLKKKKIKY